MGQQVKPATQLEFRGIITNGNPLRRPFASASYCHNLRIMPGNWLRTWGGTKARFFSTDGTWKQFHEYKDPAFSGWQNHICQHAAAANVNRWRWLSLNNWLLVEIVTITGTYDDNFASTHAAAVVNLRDRVVLYNGLGVREAAGSRPPFMAYLPTLNQNIYFGLDAHAPTAKPVVSVSGDGDIFIYNSVKVYVGLFNTQTGHFSNGVPAGEIVGPQPPDAPALPGIGIIVNTLSNLTVVFHDAIEEGFIRYVFYATNDGGEVPYLLMEPDGINPLQKILGTGNSMTITALNRDITKEMPTDNWPPRPMRWLALVSGRMYGCLMYGGIGGGANDVDFSYVAEIKFYSGVVYSAALSDAVDREFLGVPEESWPLTNFSPSPNGEIPICGAPAPDGYRLLAITGSATYLVEEAADGVHEWKKVSEVHGISRLETFVQTDHGPCWLTQRNQIVRLVGDQLEVLSNPYQTALLGKTPRFATYTLDPINQIDRYEAYFTDGKGVAYDFLSMDAVTMDGDWTAGKTVSRQDNKQFHLLANQHIVTQAGQPENGAEKFQHETYVDEDTTAYTQITGEWRSQWGDFGDSSARKTFPWIDTIGDGEQIEVEWYPDLQARNDGNKQSTVRTALPQTGAFSMHRHKMSKCDRFFYKLVLRILGRSDIDEHPLLSEYGDSEAGEEMPGAILEARYTIENVENRP